jgi:hypothetical protein
VHGTKFPDQGFTFAVNALEFLAENDLEQEEEIGWKLLADDFAVNVETKPVFRRAENVDPFFAGRAILFRKKALLKTHHYSAPFKIKPFCARRKRDNSAVELFVAVMGQKQLIHARVLAIIEVEELAGVHRFWVQVREYRRVDDVAYSSYHVLYDESSFDDYYTQLANVFAPVVFLSSSHYSALVGRPLVIACKPAIGFTCT